MGENVSEKSLSHEEKKEKIVALKKLIKDESFLNKFPYEDEAYLERFLGGVSFNVEKAFDRIKTYYELILECPEWFTKEPPLSKKNLIETDMRIALSNTDNEGRPIYIVKIGKLDPATITLFDMVAVDDIWIESILLKFASEKGLCVLIDIANLPWKALKWLTPHNIKIALRKIQCLPFKDYRFHVVNDSMLVHAAIKIIWPFLPENLKDMVNFHYSDRESLHTFIDPEVLPEEYGGKNYNINYSEIYNQLYAQNEQIFENFRAHRSLVTVD